MLILITLLTHSLAGIDFFPYLTDKEQTKLIAQGIEKGIALYKKQQKERNRQADRAKKMQQKEKQRRREQVTAQEEVVTNMPQHKPSVLPWALLVLSWIGFATYILIGR
ncbi:DUF2956 domain-containing protein [Vibrio sp. PNB22_3_1]